MNNKQKLLIWGREFELDVIPNNFPGEEVIDNQKSIINELSSIDFSDSLSVVKKFIIKHYADNLDEPNISNIFRYVIPRSILVMRDPTNKVFSIMCNFKFDMEHGMAVVYENEICKEVGLQDIIL